MKDFIAVSLALTAAAGVSRSDVFGALKASNNDPEALATNLLQYGEASDPRDAGDCANMTGYEHCTKCAMPSIQNLVTSLVAVKTEIWTDQKTIADQAVNVCNDANPAGRYGGNDKCCAAATTASKYVPAGFAGCTAETFSLESTTPVAVSTGTVGEADASSNLKYNRDHGFYFEGSGTVQPSSVIQDCCSSTSTCHANEKTLHATAAAAIADLNTAKEAIEAATASNQATEMQIELQKAKLDRTNAGIRKICLAADHVDAVFTPSTTETSTTPVEGDTTEQIAAKCPGDCQVKTIVDRQAARKVKISAHKAATEKTREVIKKVIKWLDADNNGDGDANIFDSHDNVRADGGKLGNGVKNADGFDSSLALLESATAQTTNADALASLKQATSLLQGAGRDGGTGTNGISKVIELLKQILVDFTNQINQLDTYNTQMDTEEATELSNLRGQIVNLEAERTAHLQGTQPPEFRICVCHYDLHPACSRRLEDGGVGCRVQAEGGQRREVQKLHDVLRRRDPRQHRGAPRPQDGHRHHQAHHVRDLPGADRRAHRVPDHGSSGREQQRADGVPDAQPDRRADRRAERCRPR